MSPATACHSSSPPPFPLSLAPYPLSLVQCVAAIACAELPVSQWPEVIDGLVHHVTGEQAVEKLKEASLDAIGYICEDIVSVCPLASTFVSSTLSAYAYRVCLCARLVQQELQCSCNITVWLSLLRSLACCRPGPMSYSRPSCMA